MKKITKKIVVWGMMASFCLSAVPATGFAEKYPENNYRAHGNHGKYEKEDRYRERIVMERIHVDGYYIDFLREHNLTLRDIIMAKQIADISGRLSTEDVLRMKLSGKSYKSIARKYDVYWHKVNREVDDSYRDMKDEAVKLGIVLWALDEVLR